MTIVGSAVFVASDSWRNQRRITSRCEVAERRRKADRLKRTMIDLACAYASAIASARLRAASIPARLAARHIVNKWEVLCTEISHDIRAKRLGAYPRRAGQRVRWPPTRPRRDRDCRQRLCVCPRRNRANDVTDALGSRLFLVGDRRRELEESLNLGKQLFWKARLDQHGVAAGATRSLYVPAHRPGGHGNDGN